jgi:hypothetical protein
MDKAVIATAEIAYVKDGPKVQYDAHAGTGKQKE